eukprot:5361987-Ditylum_brightwellii.AAC.1
MPRCAVIARDTRHAPDQMALAPALAGGWERTAHLVLASAYAVTSKHSTQTENNNPPQCTFIPDGAAEGEASSAQEVAQLRAEVERGAGDRGTSPEEVDPQSQEEQGSMTKHAQPQPPLPTPAAVGEATPESNTTSRDTGPRSKGASGGAEEEAVQQPVERGQGNDSNTAAEAESEQGSLDTADVDS